jgi:hypothetical protein
LACRLHSEFEPGTGSVSDREVEMPVNRSVKKMFAVVLAAGAVAVAVQFGAQGAAGATGPSARSVHNQGNPNAVPPILRPARASELAAIHRAEAQQAAALSYSAPAGARYSSADTDAYAAVARPVAVSAPAVKAPGDGFDFGAAAVGAGLAVAIIGLITVGGLALRRRRQPQYG